MSETTNSLKVDVENRIKSLAHLVSDAAKSEIMRRYLDTAAKFHRYSFLNTMIIVFTRPDASKVAGFNKWKDMGRFVKKGEKGIAILAPVFTRKEDTPEGQQPRLVGFKTVYVFDIAQTDGQPLPDAPEWEGKERSEELHAGLVSFCKAKGIDVETVDDLGGAQGVSMGGKIKLLATAGTMTFVHEIAHELLHQNDEARKTLGRGEKELEAEAIAYVVSTHFGLEGATAPNYLALWRADGDAIMQRMSRIHGAATAIIKAIEPERAEA